MRMLPLLVVFVLLAAGIGYALASGAAESARDTFHGAAPPFSAPWKARPDVSRGGCNARPIEFSATA